MVHKKFYDDGKKIFSQNATMCSGAAAQQQLGSNPGLTISYPYLNRIPPPTQT